MSATKHVLVPRNFDAGDIASLNRGRLARFHHMTAAEVRDLERQGVIVKIAPKLWRLAGEIAATVRASETGDGLLLRGLGKEIRALMHSEMTGRPIEPDTESTR